MDDQGRDAVGGWGDRQGLMIAGGGGLGEDEEEGRGEGGQKMNGAHVE